LLINQGQNLYITTYLSFSQADVKWILN